MECNLLRKIKPSSPSICRWILVLSLTYWNIQTSTKLVCAFRLPVTSKNIGSRTNDVASSRITTIHYPQSHNGPTPVMATTRLYATIAIEKGSSSALGDDDDNNDDEEDTDEDDDIGFGDDNMLLLIQEDEDEQTQIEEISRDIQQQPAGRRRKKKGSNSAMRDPQFLRKRTADLVKASNEMMQKAQYLQAEDIDCILPTYAESSLSGDSMSASTVPYTADEYDCANLKGIIGRNMKVEPKTFHFLLDAWAFSNEDDSAEKAIQLLECMEQCCGRISSNSATPPTNETLLFLEPDVRSYTKTMNAIARCGAINAGVQAEVIFQRMKKYGIEPNSFTYTALIQAHANSGASVRAHELLQILIQRFELEYQQHERGHNNIHNTFVTQSLSSPLGSTTLLQPTSKAFQAVMYAYSKAGQPENVEIVVSQIEELYNKYGDTLFGSTTAFRPNHFHYNTLISAWANSQETYGAERAEYVLKRMKKYVQPTTVSYNAVIDAYAKFGLADKAEALLRTMLDSDGSSAPKPNTRSFNSVMNAWAKSKHIDNALNAEIILDLMEKRYEQGDANVRPDVHSFCTVINAWARSMKNDKANRAYTLFKEMEKLFKAGNKDVRPNVVAVNAVMNACAYTTPDDIRTSTRAVDIAHTILKRLEQQTFPLYGKPDQITYGTFLKVCEKQMPDSNTREQIVNVMFRKCVNSGQLGNFVLQQIASMASDELYFELLGRHKMMDAFLQMDDLPKAWSCNVVEGKKQIQNQNAKRRKL